MILSDERQSHLARLVIDGLWQDELLEYTDDDKALRAAKKAIAQFVKDSEQIDQAAREKVASLKRNVHEGSPEWDVLYQKYFEEELARRGKS